MVAYSHGHRQVRGRQQGDQEARGKSRRRGWGVGVSQSGQKEWTREGGGRARRMGWDHSEVRQGGGRGPGKERCMFRGLEMMPLPFRREA